MPLMQRFEGERTFARSIAELWPKLSDAAFLAGCVPDATLTGEPDHDRARYAVRPGFSFARGSLDVTMEILERHEPDMVRFRLTSKGIGSSSVVESALSLTAQGAGTKVAWTAEVTQLGGLLKMVPAGLIRGAAQKVIADVWDGIAKQLLPLAG
jgi:carbon monoxide dehydrogenase subunit G